MSIKLSVSASEPMSVAADVLVLGIIEGAPLTEGAAGELSRALGSVMTKTVKRTFDASRIGRIKRLLQHFRYCIVERLSVGVRFALPI